MATAAVVGRLIDFQERPLNLQQGRKNESTQDCGPGGGNANGGVSAIWTPSTRNKIGRTSGKPNAVLGLFQNKNVAVSFEKGTGFC